MVVWEFGTTLVHRSTLDKEKFTALITPITQNRRQDSFQLELSLRNQLINPDPTAMLPLPVVQPLATGRKARTFVTIKTPSSSRPLALPLQTPSLMGQGRLRESDKQEGQVQLLARRGGRMMHDADRRRKHRTNGMIEGGT